LSLFGSGNTIAVLCDGSPAAFARLPGSKWGNLLTGSATRRIGHRSDQPGEQQSATASSHSAAVAEVPVGPPGAEGAWGYSSSLSRAGPFCARSAGLASGRFTALVPKHCPFQRLPEFQPLHGFLGVSVDPKRVRRRYSMGRIQPVRIQRFTVRSNLPR